MHVVYEKVPGDRYYATCEYFNTLFIYFGNVFPMTVFNQEYFYVMVTLLLTAIVYQINVNDVKWKVIYKLYNMWSFSKLNDFIN